MNKFLLLSLLLAATTMFAQSIEHYEKLAIASFYTKDFPTALLCSEKVVAQDGQNIASLFFAGESARLLNQLDKAEAYLEKIPDEAKAGYFSVTDYHLGLVKQNLNKRDEAKNYYESYLNRHYKESNLYTQLAQRAVHSLASGDDWTEQGSHFEKLPDNINTEHADLAPLRYADKLYFSTILEENYLPTKSRKRNKKLVKHPVARVYEAQFGRKARESNINPKSAVLSASNVTLMPDASRMYYTLCSDESPEEQEECTIWYRQHFYDGKWGPAVKLPSHINMSRHTHTQPSVGYDWQLKKYLLFFVSDRPGGVGGKDIWCSEIETDGTFGEPYPVPINTAGDEVTPFYHQASQTLFFSSKGWKSLGGYDIFHTKKTEENEWEAPENMGPYLNSEQDETYYTFHTSSKFAYFVSGNDVKQQENTLSSDIFEARVFVDFKVRVFDNYYKKPLRGAHIEIMDESTGAKGVFNTNENSHDLSLKLEPGVDYKFTIKVNGFHPHTFKLDTSNISYFTELEENVFLRTFARP